MKNLFEKYEPLLVTIAIILLIIIGVKIESRQETEEARHYRISAECSFPRKLMAVTPRQHSYDRIYTYKCGDGKLFETDFLMQENP